MIDSLIVLWVVTAVGAGLGTGLLGSCMVIARIPFLAICMSHAALAGGIVAMWLNAPVWIGALAGSLVVSAVLTLAERRLQAMTSQTLVAVLFSLMLALAFLAMHAGDDAVGGQLGFLWGNLLFVRWSHAGSIWATTLLAIVFMIVAGKEMRAILFSRTLATAGGVHVATVWAVFLVLVALTFTVNLGAVGGLMIYSLMTNPAAAALQLVRTTGRVLVASALLGALSAIGGFLLAWQCDWPTGASIVLVSSLLVVVAAIIRRIRGVQD